MKTFTIREIINNRKDFPNGKPVGFNNVSSDNAILKMLKPQKDQDNVNNLSLGQFTIYEGGFTSKHKYLICRTDGKQLEDFLL